MSVNITVNGKFGKRCPKSCILGDLDQEEKELIAEKRKQRILQVREKSKEIARKLREDVKEEKQRQLRKFEELKARECEAFTVQPLSKMQQDYCASFSHVGAAHRAAKIENEQRAAKNKMKNSCTSSLQNKTNKPPKLPSFSQVGASYYAPHLKNEKIIAMAKPCYQVYCAHFDNQCKNFPENACSDELRVPQCSGNTNRIVCGTVNKAQPSTTVCIKGNNQPSENRSCYRQTADPCCNPNSLCQPQIASSNFGTNAADQCHRHTAPQCEIFCTNLENHRNVANSVPDQPCSSEVYAVGYAEKEHPADAPKKAARLRPKVENKPNKPSPSTKTKQPQPKKDTYLQNKKRLLESKKPTVKSTSKGDKINRADVAKQTTSTQTELSRQAEASKRSNSVEKPHQNNTKDLACRCCPCNDTCTDSSSDTCECCDASSTDSTTENYSRQQENCSNVNAKSNKQRNRNMNIELDVECDDVVTISPGKTMATWQESPGQETDSDANISENEVASNKTKSKPSEKSDFEKSKRNQLRQTPAVFLDLDVGCEDIVTITTPHEFGDRFTETNRQFSSVIRVSPPEKHGKLCDPNQNQNKLTKRNSSFDENLESASQQKGTSSTSQAVASSEQSVPCGNRPRFTQISDLIQKNSSNYTMRSQTRCDTITILDANRAKQPFSESSRDTLESTTAKQPEATEKEEPSITTKKKIELPKKFVDSVTLFRKKKVYSCPTNTASTSSARSTTHVQFYDYTNKYSKSYQQPVGSVAVVPKDQKQPDAMDQAVLEQQQQSTREKKSDDYRKRSNERGKKAIEREQVRRDCNELTQKLEALSKQRTTLLPPDSSVRPRHRFTDAAARNEVKMNAAIEDLLMRPAVITCPEIKQRKTTRPDVSAHAKAGPTAGTINLGATASSACHPDSSAHSSDSYRSVLLGYVNDQSNQIKKDINQYEAHPQQNHDKSKRLHALLLRIEKLRCALIAELQSSGESNSNEERVEEVINSISAVRKERENIIIDGIAKNAINPLQQREKELQQKEAILESKIKEFYELQKNCKPRNQNSIAKSTIDKGAVSPRRKLGTTNKPLEIIIKVCSADNSPRSAKSPRNPTTLKHHSPITKKKNALTAAKQKIPAAKIPYNRKTLLQVPHVQQASFDSYSTSYRSLPAAGSTDMNRELDRNERNNVEHEAHTKLQRENRSTTALNPLIAHYVQRLLGMSRNSIKALCVSSSEIETPSSSLINTTANRSGNENEIVSQVQMDLVKKFIEENHNFINELEESLRGSNNTNSSLESTMKVFEGIWKEKFCKKIKASQDTQRTGKPLTAKPECKSGRRAEPTQAKVKERVKAKASPKKDKEKRIPSPSSNTKAKASPKKDTEKRIPSPSSNSKAKASPKKDKERRTPTPSSSAKRNESPSIGQSSDVDSNQAELIRCNQLTESCTQRIAELTALINKVRKEKQQILENTLSSGSDNGCSSTESSEHCVTNVVCSESSSSARQEEATHLEKHKRTGVSKDSGISESRPHTPQENLEDMCDPSTSSSKNISSSRKTRPPSTMSRFGHHLPEEEVAHELSTIAEVDTPMTSRVSTSANACNAMSTVQERALLASSFPTFEQYVLLLNLDISNMTPEQSMQINQEFQCIIEALTKAGQSWNINEFPSIHNYLRNLALSPGDQSGCITLSESASEYVEDFFKALGLHTVGLDEFPNSSDYIRHIQNNTPATASTDSKHHSGAGSLQKATSECAESDSESLDIEYELKQRNILRSTFHRDENDTHRKENSDVESGIEKLSTSSNQSGNLQEELCGAGMQWPKTTRKKSKETEALISSSPSTSPNPASDKNAQIAPKKIPIIKITGATGDGVAEPSHSKKLPTRSQRVRTLRDFLSQELLKHSCSLSSSNTPEESLRSNFLNSIIGTLTPSVTPRSTAPVSKKKTSTPVNDSPSMRSSSSPNRMSAQLFTSEQCLSSVSYQYSPSSSKNSKGSNNVDRNGEND